MPVTTILLARHGETDWNREHRIQGHSDVPLNATGRAQAAELAALLAGEPLDAVYSSDLSRAVATAGVVAEAKGLAVAALPELREKDFGTWEGLTDAEVAERFPDALPGHWGNGETAAAMSERVLCALRRIAARHPGGRVLVVTHGGPLRAIARHLTGEPPPVIPNCHVVRVAVEDGRVRPL